MTVRAAKELGRLRWKGMTKKEQDAHVKMMSKARQTKLTPEERSASARKAAQARWGKKAGKKKEPRE